MSYPGNASLAPDIQNRVLDTFQQTLKLVEDESPKEARLGCDFILRLDPMFEPARWLQDRLDKSDGEIVLDDLKEALAGARTAVGAEAGETTDEPEESVDAKVDQTISESDETQPEPQPEPEPVQVPETEPEPEPEPEETVAEAPDEAEIELPDSLDEIETSSDAEPEMEVEPSPEPEPELELEAEPEPEPEVETAPEPELESDEEPAATQASSFDGDAPTPEPATQEEVMSAPVAALDTESERRIQDLLTEGQAAFDGGEYQTAIDAWSRIFLIDIDHPEANGRIEAARKLKAEAERTVEEAFHEALSQIESGATEEGRAGLEKVLEMQPDHLAAREQLEKLDGGGAAEPPVETPSPEEIPEAAEEPTEGDPESLLSDIDEELERPGKTDDIEAQVAPIPIAKPKKQPKAKVAGGDKKKLLLYVGAAIVVLVLVGAWFLISNWSNFFPNTAETVEGTGERPNPIERAEELHAAGKTSTAIAQLKRLPPQHELYSEAQALVAQWEAAAEAESRDVELTEADLAEFDSLVEQAKTAQARGEFLLVDEVLTRAQAIQPLDEDAAGMKSLAGQELEPIRTQVAVFRQGEWELVLRDLWRLREDMPENADINRLMVDSYYNLGVRALQRGDTISAAEHFGEALELTGTDAELDRANRFAQTYQNRPEDLLYRIYVKYLPFR